MSDNEAFAFGDSADPGMNDSNSSEEEYFPSSVEYMLDKSGYQASIAVWFG